MCECWAVSTGITSLCYPQSIEDASKLEQVVDDEQAVDLFNIPLLLS